MKKTSTAKKTSFSWDDQRTYNQYIKEIEKYPLLSRQEEIVLLQQIQKGNRKALDRLVCSNLKFVIKVAFKYVNKGLSLTELINEGNIGLMDAAHRFDIQKNVKFITFAVWWIRHAINKAIHEKARLVRIPVQTETLIRKIQQDNHNQSPLLNYSEESVVAFGKKMNTSKQQVEQAITLSQKSVSLDAPLQDASSRTFLDSLEDTQDTSPEEASTQRSVKQFLKGSLALLLPRERKILEYYFGLQNAPLSLGEIGDITGISKERVRQIKEDGLKKLKELLHKKEYLLAA
jgi:RNA polymerase primary sigma factor